MTSFSSSVAFTMNIYSHIIERVQEDAMALLDEVLPAGVFQKNNAKLAPTMENLVSKQDKLPLKPA